MKFIKPIDGDVLFTYADGKPYENGILTEISVSAPKGRNITINGNKAKEENGVYTAQVYLDAYRNAVEVNDTETGEMQTIYVYWFKNGYKTYRLGVDDVIICFKNMFYFF